LCVCVCEENMKKQTQHTQQEGGEGEEGEEGEGWRLVGT
jgi:hypothetical protein